MQLKLMIDSRSFKNKPKNEEIGRIKNQSKPYTVSFDGYVTATENGQTITPAVLNGTKASDWQEQQLFMVDIDNHNKEVELLSIDKAIAICRDNGVFPAFYYYTFSHSEDLPKFRLGFIMDEVIREESKRRVIINTLVGLFEQADKGCCNADRMFFGTNSKVVVIDEAEYN